MIDMKLFQKLKDEGISQGNKEWIKQITNYE